MFDLVRSIGPEGMDCAASDVSLREWLVTNGLGGYACGTVCGRDTRRYHGLLVAALPVPLGRTMMLNRLSEWLVDADGRLISLGSGEVAEVGSGGAQGALVEFRIEAGLPVWRFDVG